MWGRKWGLRWTEYEVYVYTFFWKFKFHSQVEAVCSVKRKSVHFYNMSEIHQAACRRLLLQTNHGAEGGRKKQKTNL